MKVLDYVMHPITYISTPFPEKFGVPRQPLIIPEAIGKMVFPKNEFFSEAFRGIESLSHLCLIFQFHLVDTEEFNGLVRPPRFLGTKKLGVFATRTPHRPNRLGLSVVKFESIEFSQSEIQLVVSGVDLVDGTPIFDIKPYIPYSDQVEGAVACDFSEPPQFFPVIWACEKPKEAALIEKVIALDPRPAFDRVPGKEFGVSLAGWNVRFKEAGGSFVITKVSALLNNHCR